MYKKFLIIASKLDTAGMNIITQLTQFGQFDIDIREDEIIYTKNLNLGKISEYDFIIFASKHRSSKNEKALTVHSVGNPKIAEFGGEAGKFGRTSALFMKQIFEKLNENVKKFDLRNYNITMEATHHGPLIEKPCVFIEIGSSEFDYKDKKAGFVIARTITDTIKSFRENPYNEVALGIGGPHYCPNFNKLQKDSNVAISFVIPSYSLPLTTEMLKEAIEKTEEPVDFVVLDWKSFNAGQRIAAIKVIEDNYMQWRKTSDFK